jgi:hypothetical protein
LVNETLEQESARLKAESLHKTIHSVNEARAEAAEHALRAIELEREAVKHCDSLSNPRYCQLMQESLRERQRAENYVHSQNYKIAK